MDRLKLAKLAINAFAVTCITAVINHHLNLDLWEVCALSFAGSWFFGTMQND